MSIDFLMHPIALRRELHESFRRFFDQYMPANAIVYDVGCGQKPFASFLERKVSKHIGVDLIDGFYQSNQVDLMGTAYDVPAPDGAADAVILSQVIEHLESPLLAMQEVYRLLKPGGVVFLSFPFLYPQHAPPHDYLRFTEFYLVNKIAGDGFEVVDSAKFGGYWYLMGMYSAMYLQEVYRGLLKMSHLLKFISAAIGWTCLALHKTEGAILCAAGKDVVGIRAKWTANHLVILRKIKRKE